MAAALLASATITRAQNLKPLRKVHLQTTQEPSDFTPSLVNGSFYVVSDHGKLAECSADGKQLRQVTDEGADYEGVCVWNNHIYLSEESFRQVREYDAQTLALIRSYPVPYEGGRNEGVEAICRNEEKECFILITEKNPSILFETNDQFQIVAQFESPVAEVSSVTWHNGHLYLLSDEGHRVYKLDPQSYKVLTSWSVPVINPEGICFLPSGDLCILSDDLASYFVFNLPNQ